MDYDSNVKQTDPLLGTTNSRPPPFNAEYGAPPQYTPDYQRQGYIQQPGHYGGAGSTSTVSGFR
jgi:hypothetical protein